VALGIEHGGAPWPCHTSSPDLRFAHAGATQPRVFSVIRDQDSARNSPRGTTSGRGHREMARDGGRLDHGLGAVGQWPKGAVHRPQARCGVIAVQNVTMMRRGERDEIYRVF
jgi:hypothetical protein